MKFGINTFLWAEQFGPDKFPLLRTIKEHGFDGVEVPLFQAAGFNSGALRRALEEHELEATACSVLPAAYSLIDTDSDVRNRTVTHVSDCVKAAANAGISIVAGPIYSPVGYLTGRRRTQEEWSYAVAAYQTLAPVLESYQVHIAIEPLNRFETFFLNTTADAARLCEEIGHPNVGILWDTFHANIEEKQPAEELKKAGRFIKHLHTCENDRGTPGTGHVNWAEFFGVVRAIGYDGWLTIESFGFSLGTIAAAASIWRDLAPTVDEIAWKGVEFLKRSVRSTRNP
jgi:D-psicose/D-tagatose/L-ribulose 3-epimerase